MPSARASGHPRHPARARLRLIRRAVRGHAGPVRLGLRVKLFAACGLIMLACVLAHAWMLIGLSRGAASLNDAFSMTRIVEHAQAVNPILVRLLAYGELASRGDREALDLVRAHTQSIEGLLVQLDALSESAPQRTRHQVYVVRKEWALAREALQQSLGPEAMLDPMRRPVLDELLMTRSSQLQQELATLHSVLRSDLDQRATLTMMWPERLMVHTLSWLGVMIFMLGGLCWFVSRSVLRPLSRLREAAAALRRGRHPGDLSDAANDEFGELSAALQALASRAGLGP